MDNEEVNQLIKENDNLRNELTIAKNNYKQLSTELGQTIFKTEDLEKEVFILKKENGRLLKENEELKKFKEEIESSTSWKVKTLFK